MSEMVERVAQALHAYWLQYYDGPKQLTPWDDLGHMHKTYGVGLARAAIAAMREPTQDMWLAYAPDATIERNWRAMIDEALK